MAQWDPERETVVEADSSGYAMGACHSQTDSQGRLRPVAHFSKSLSGAEMNYQIPDKEFLAIVSSVRERKADLQSLTKPFTILTDNEKLKYFATKRLHNE